MTRASRSGQSGLGYRRFGGAGGGKGTRSHRKGRIEAGQLSPEKFKVAHYLKSPSILCADVLYFSGAFPPDIPTGGSRTRKSWAGWPIPDRLRLPFRHGRRVSWTGAALVAAPRQGWNLTPQIARVCVPDITSLLLAPRRAGAFSFSRRPPASKRSRSCGG